MKLAKMPDGTPEIFFTIQGEGRNVGKPSVFIRASLCNLHCQWCDTDYTWNWEETDFDHEKSKRDPSYQKFSKTDYIQDLAGEEIVEFVGQYPCTHFVLTGGEPLIQEKGWMELIGLLGDDATFEIETNGTLFPDDAFLNRLSQINVSPKLGNSGVEKSLRFKPDVLEQFAGTDQADFKFVVGNDTDLSEVDCVVERFQLIRDRVFLMPKAGTASELVANQDWVSRIAMERGFRYSDRLHIRLFGSQRGV